MRSSSIKSVLLAGALIAFVSANVQANTITPSFAAFAAGTSITYNADVTSGELHTNDGFTIFDIGLFTSVLATPAGWTSSTQLVGSPYSPPLPGGPDTSRVNVTFKYTGPSFETLGLTPFLGFVIGTSATELTVDDWVSKDHLVGAIGCCNGGLSSGKTDQIVVPAALPEDGSTAVFLGLGLIAVATFGRKLLV